MIFICVTVCLRLPVSGGAPYGEKCEVLMNCAYIDDEIVETLKDDFEVVEASDDDEEDDEDEDDDYDFDDDMLGKKK